jgi:tetratricopeptide (TPR) repeat protein
MRRASDAPELLRVLEGLKDVYSDERFYRLESLHAVLVRDFNRAVSLALEWNETTFRDPMAPSTAMYLLTDISGDLDRAIKIGRAALPRFPGSKSLINNLAYTLALAGKYSEARRLLSPLDDDVHVLATRGLTELLSGRTRIGLALYDDAAKLAEERRDSELAQLVRYNQALFTSLARRRLGSEAADVDDIRLEFPRDWENDSSLVLLAALADREGIPYDVV